MACMVVGMVDNMRYCQVLVVMVWVCGVHGDSGEGVDGLEEGFMFDDISNDTALDYNEGSGDGEADREPFRDIPEFPVCVTDEDCEEISMDSGSDYRCFQYMCYPWGRGGGGGRSGAARGGQTVTVSSETRFQVSRPRPRLPKSKSQHRDRDRDYESCSLSFETETETMNLKVSVTRLRPRPRILVSMSRLTPRPRLDVNNL